MLSVLKNIDQFKQPAEILLSRRHRTKENTRQQYNKIGSVIGGLFSIIAGILLAWIFYIKVMSMYSGSNDIIQKQLFSNDNGGSSDE